MSQRSPKRGTAPGRSACASAIPADLEHLRRYAELARNEAGFARYLDEFVLERGRRRMIDCRPEELLIDVLAGMLEGLGSRRGRRGLADPGRRGVPRARARGRPHARSRSLGSERHNPFTDGGVELFDCAAQGRIDAFFLGGGEIDGQANINLVGVGGYPHSRVRWPGSFGSAYLYFLVPRVILFREEHTPRVLVPKVEFISAPGTSPAQRLPPGRPPCAGHRSLRVRFRPRARPIPPAQRASRAHDRRGRGQHGLRLRAAGGGAADRRRPRPRRSR